ncbi:hypothetical protein KDK95_27495 [Actinospica sp. MGRD01-02]|uniref:Uncharacterized protein n=1 Tax=Actinospica acidithermotolerans TaxID=2828514 RepID=A0A941EG17_9ACTN|nr:hypothetical protein [Actinospica acidithermotolerans]MBR7830078.1 hypothetical protein [Actinospica acidithermotolerans]
MLTQFQIPEPQAALLAACPRPRAVAPSAVSPLTPSSSPAWAGSVRLGVATVTRVVAEERPAGLAGHGMRAFAFSTATRPAGYAAAARVFGAGVVGNGSTSKDQQDKQHLTDRRGTVTWRPPH